ncbi:MAG TPA: radical SAM protein [Bryobacterales bacterium]|nr:radical SAM protein [Bryobacterales bacterium]
MTTPDTYRPRLIFWELTTGCNLRCIHCRASATELMSPEDLSYQEACGVIDQIAAYAPFILVLSGGEPLWRPDVFDLAERARARNIRVALATNGTLVDDAMADRIVAAGIRRVAISLDGADAATHDSFRGQAGAFQAALDGFRRLRARGMSMQVNTTVSRHNERQLPQILDLALSLGADAFHIFLLVPVGCGLTIQDEQMVSAAHYEDILNWFYDRSLEGRLEMKATCAPHYFRIVRQRRAEMRRAGLPVPELPGPQGHAAGRPGDGSGMNAMTRGCLAGSAVCFLSHRGDVYPCGYLPVSAGNVRETAFREIWENAPVFADLRDPGLLEGKCGVCEFRQVCLGCRARAYGITNNYLAEEPFCAYQPRGAA